ncbi:4'-phosphopantetheinyl transferase superfamily protein [Chloracidobacterium sp. MS 40/45]|uniref:4'-phosphopantetheinyl transferase family protein n=1 Tax=Chloracidobacterium aggregatum TaxID=2851959 RepID=UPI001B8C5B57|nr:4'-phosphopantetheinyl transferase superfamily protein [Chloracidobacterium aggregatum]QUV99087.1 4'-phosphopantetheinyl transferase superfamily protein [Chloracidobacterium sp. MS 40/45]
MLSSAAVHLWWLHLPRSARVETTESLLSTDEQQRARRFRRPAAARQFCLGRALLRTILGSYLGLPPQHLRFAYTHNGKPYLPETPHLTFSLTHTGDLGLLAVTCHRRVGVDVEAPHRRANWRGLARRCLSDAAYRTLGTLPDEEQRQAMTWYWVCHEAWLKARGEASLRRLLHIDLPWARACAGDASHITMQDVSGQTWLIRNVSRDGICAALVVECAPDASIEVVIFDRSLDWRWLPQT